MVPQITVFAQGQGSAGADDLNSKVTTCASVAQMRSVTGVSNMTLYLLGLVAPADGGQGTFYWNPTSTGPDDGVNVIQPTGVQTGAWVRIPPIAGITIYPMAFEFLGSPPGSLEVMGMHTLRMNVNFPANFGAIISGQTSGGFFKTAATANFTATIADQAANPLGSMSVAAAAHAPTFVTTGGLGLALTAGTTVILTGPSVVDATLANGAWTLLGVVAT